MIEIIIILIKYDIRSTPYSDWLTIFFRLPVFVSPRTIIFDQITNRILFTVLYNRPNWRRWNAVQVVRNCTVLVIEIPLNSNIYVGKLIIGYYSNTIWGRMIISFFRPIIEEQSYDMLHCVIFLWSVDHLVNYWKFTSY